MPYDKYKPERVTLRDVYDAINRVEDKMEARIKYVEENLQQVRAFQNKAIGILAFLSIVFTTIATLIWNLITGK